MSTLFPSGIEIDKLDWPSLLALGAIGLGFCYIASAPILVLHATRGIIDSGDKSYKKWRNVFVSVCCLAAISCIGWMYYGSSQPSKFGGGVVLALVLAFQWGLVISALGCKRDVVNGYYARLSKARSSKSGDAPEFIESYRHLREHGNAFFVLVCEVALGAILWSFQISALSILILVLWIMPAVFVWMIGSNLERHFVEKSQ